MNQKNSLNIALIVFGFLLLGIGGYFVFIEKTESPLLAPESSLAPYLTRDMALSLLQGKELLFFTECVEEGIQGDYGSCIIDITQEENQWIVTITHSGLFDDSISATRIRAIVTHQDDQWIVGESSETQKCWPNRGHQDFSTEFCV